MSELEGSEPVIKSTWFGGPDVVLACLLHVFGGVGLAIYASTGVDGWKHFGNGLLVALASSAFGLFIGFFFGIPHALQQSATTAGTQDQKNADDKTKAAERRRAQLKYQQSTNLEQISDWLTKMIVGIGLSQLTKFPEKYLTLGEYFQPALGDKYMALAVIIYFQIAGFLSGWMLTRLRLMELFVRADKDASDAAEIKEEAVLIMNRANMSDADPASAAPLADNEQKAAKNLAEQPLDAQKSIQEMIAWSKAQLVTGNFGAAANGYRKALAQDPTNATVRAELAVALSRLKDRDNAIRELESALKQAGEGLPEESLKMLKSLVFNYLYEPPPGGFTKAIEAANHYLERRTSTTVLVYLASAYGQQYAYLKSQKASKEELANVRSQALDAVRKALARSDAKKRLPTLRALLHPSKKDDEAGENDLKSFQGDPDFEALIGTEAGKAATSTSASESTPTKSDAPKDSPQ